MAQRVVIRLEDDLDGSEADETVRFGIDGVNYEIDLSTKNATKLRDELQAYVESGRRVGGRRTTGAAKRRAGSDVGEIRTWAREHGYEVSDRGRVSAEVRAAYEAAN